MPNAIEGEFSAGERTFAIVVSRFNESITKRLLEGARDCLHRYGAVENQIDVVFCPGAFEIPQTAHHLAKSGKYHAIICLGCVIRGETPHFEYIASAAAHGIDEAARTTGVPMSFGVLTTDNLEQAIERAGAKGGNKGWDAAMSALEMAELFGTMERSKR